MEDFREGREYRVLSREKEVSHRDPKGEDLTRPIPLPSRCLKKQ